MVKCLLFGITGQTASYLADLLVSKDAEVHGVIRRGSTINTIRIDHLLFPKQKITLHYGDVTDTNSIYKVLMDVKPDEIYNASAMSHVGISFDIPEYTMDVVGLGVLRILEAIKTLRNHGVLRRDVKFLQFSSSEMFGLSPPPQDESTPFLPVSPYGVSKLAGFNLQRSYRFGYGLFCCGPICFNNESPRRGENFVTKKIVRSACRIKLGTQEKIKLGNLTAKRDWGASWEYADAVYKIMNHSEPDDFCISTGEYYSVDDFLHLVFKRLNLDVDEHVDIDDRYKRPLEVPELRGNSRKAHDVLGWEPKVKLPELVDIIISAVMEEEKKKKYHLMQDAEKERLKQ